jgi:hypothetical protein
VGHDGVAKDAIHEQQQCKTHYATSNSQHNDNDLSIKMDEYAGGTNQYTSRSLPLIDHF